MKFKLKETTLQIDGESLALREIAAMDMLRLAKMFSVNGNAEDHGAWQTAIIAKSVIDENGNRCLDSEEGRQTVEQWPLKVWQQVADNALRLNGLDDETKKN